MTIPLNVRFEILQRDRFTCRFCGRRAPETELEVDHLRPRAKGGSDDLENLAASCRDCNRGKSDRIVELRQDWSIVGSFVHQPCSGRLIRRQGQIVDEVAPQIYVVEFYSWITGMPSFGQELIRLSQMVDERWLFYRTAEAMNDAYEHGGLAHRGHEPCCSGERQWHPKRERPIS